MITMARKRIASDWAIHPGELLGEELEARGLTQKALADALGRPARTVNEIIRGKKAITAETAVQLEAALGTPAYLWIGLQSEYELIRAQQKPGVLDGVRALADGEQRPVGVSRGPRAAVRPRRAAAAARARS